MPADERYETFLRALEARTPSRMVPDLDRIATLCGLLGRPDQAYPAVQITGTNGKTSVAAMATSLLGALGLTAGTYTSPHLQDVRERIRVAGEPITPDDVVAGLSHLQPFLAEVDARLPDPVTYFEVLTALAYVHFADAPVDAAVLEVGMGGRWDATNLARGEVAVVNRVGLDHTDVLGGTVEDIAREKAGVVKDGAAVVSAPQQAAVEAVLLQAVKRHGASLVVAGRDFAVAGRRLAVGGQELDLRGVTGRVDDVWLPLHGEHQATNAACALAAVEGFLGFAGGLDPETVRAGFAAVRVPGRLEVVRRPEQAPVVLDGAHNADGARTLAATLRDEFGYRHRVAVLGVLDDKDADAIVAALLPVVDHVVVTEPPSGRAAPADRLAKAVTSGGGSVETAADVAAAIEQASGVAAREDAVVVAGSLYTVGAARRALGLPVT
ncbi:folylpolyglutamate synthase/dihydrofolate synthase family protein [soil metagenome]